MSVGSTAKKVSPSYGIFRLRLCVICGAFFSHTIGTKPALACLNIVSVLQAQSLCITHPSVDTVTLVNGLWKRGSLCCGKYHYLWEYTRQSPLRIYLLRSKKEVPLTHTCVVVYILISSHTWIVLKTFRFLEKFLDVIELRNCFSWLLDHLVRYHDWLVIYVHCSIY